MPQQIKYFNGNPDITHYIIPRGVKNILNREFENCHELKWVNLPNTVTVLKGCSFQYCTALESIFIPNSVTDIEDLVFFGCSGLKIIELPQGLKKIGFGAFQWCTSLKSIIIPESVIFIDKNVFFGCITLETIIAPSRLVKAIKKDYFPLQKIKIWTYEDVNAAKLIQGAFRQARYNPDFRMCQNIFKKDLMKILKLK